MTDGFNSCRNVVCNFTEGNIKALNCIFLSGYYLLQELCILACKYAEMHIFFNGKEACL